MAKQYEFQEYPKCMYGPKVDAEGARERVGVANQKEEAAAFKRGFRASPADFAAEPELAQEDAPVRRGWRRAAEQEQQTETQE